MQGLQKLGLCKENTNIIGSVNISCSCWSFKEMKSFQPYNFIEFNLIEAMGLVGRAHMVQDLKQTEVGVRQHHGFDKSAKNHNKEAKEDTISLYKTNTKWKWDFTFLLNVKKTIIFHTWSFHCSDGDNVWFGSRVQAPQSWLPTTRTAGCPSEARGTADWGLKEAAAKALIWGPSGHGGQHRRSHLTQYSPLNSHVGIWTRLTISLYFSWLPRCVSLLWERCWVSVHLGWGEASREPSCWGLVLPSVSQRETDKQNCSLTVAATRLFCCNINQYVDKSSWLDQIYEGLFWRWAVGTYKKSLSRIQSYI